MTPALIDTLRHIVGPTHLLLDGQVRERHSNGVPPRPLTGRVLVRPASTAEVAAVLAACHGSGTPVVTQGGTTGLVHGADAGDDEVILSLERLRRILSVDPIQRVLVAEAGVPLEAAQQAAAEQGLLLPVDLGARGSATLGGMVATNAGGNKVLRHGMMRESVLGLEAVLADGTVLSSLNRLIKNNAGFDLKQLFIGSEGTLGVVTQVVLRLREASPGRQMALLALADEAAVAPLLRQLDRAAAGQLAAFEVMWPDYYRLVTTPPAISRPPLPQDHPLYVLIEVTSPAEGGGEALAELLAPALEAGLIADAMLAASERECAALWELRDDVAQMGRGGPPQGYDVSLPLAHTCAYVSQTTGAIRARWPQAQVWSFGHLGDGNVHLVVQVPGLDETGRAELDRRVYDPLRALGGSISAEHGIGSEKKAWLGHSRSPAEIALMRRLKRSLDPRGILNPGRVIDVDGATDPT